MLDADVFGNRVAAPCAAAERERRRRFEIVQVADGALRGRRIDEHTAGLHRLLPLFDLRLFGDRIDIEGGSVAVTAVRDQAFRFLHGVVEIFRAVQSEHGGKFFVRERLFEFHALHFSDEDLGRCGHGKAGRSRRSLPRSVPRSWR